MGRFNKHDRKWYLLNIFFLFIFYFSFVLVAVCNDYFPCRELVKIHNLSLFFSHLLCSSCITPSISWAPPFYKRSISLLPIFYNLFYSLLIFWISHRREAIQYWGLHVWFILLKLLISRCIYFFYKWFKFTFIAQQQFTCMLNLIFQFIIQRTSFFALLIPLEI